MHRGQHRLRRRVGLSRQWAIIGNSLRSKYLWGTPAIEPAQAVFHHPPNCFSAAAENAPGESSRTCYTPAYDVADRILARSDPARPCRRARCKEGSAHRNEVPLRRPDDADIWTMSFPKAGHIRGLRHARKGLVSCLRLETTEVLPGAVAVSSDGIQPCRSCLFHVKAQKYAAGSAERPLRVHEQGAPA